MKTRRESQVIGEKRTDTLYASSYLNSVLFLNTPLFLFTALNSFLPINPHTFFEPVIFAYWRWGLVLLIKCFEDNNKLSLKPYMKVSLGVGLHSSKILTCCIHPVLNLIFSYMVYCYFLSDNYVALDRKLSTHRALINSVEKQCS